MRQKRIGLFSTISPTGVDQSAGQSLRALAGLSEQVGDIAFNIGAKKRQKEGQIAGAEAGIEAAKKGESIETKDSLFSIHDQAYDESMKTAYVGSIDSDNKEKFKQLATDHGTDTKLFVKNGQSYIDGVLKNLDPESKIILEQGMNDTFNSYAREINIAEKNQNMKIADDLHVTAINNNTEDALNYAYDGDYENAASKLINVHKLLESRLNSGQISKSEYEKQIKATTNVVDVEANRNQFKQILNTNNVSNAINFLQKVADEKIKGKTPEQHRDLLSVLGTDMNKHYSLLEQEETESAEERETFQKDNAGDLFVKMIDGDVSASQISLAIANDSISLEQGKSLITTLNQRGTGVDNYDLILDISQITLTDPELAKQMIMENMGTRITGKTATSLWNVTNDGKDGVLSQPLVKRFRSHLKDQVKYVNQFGWVDKDKQQQAGKLLLMYDERVIAGEEPAEVAKELMDIDVALNTPPDEAKKELTGLTDTYRAGLESGKPAMTPDEYNREVERLNALIENQTLINNFWQSYEAAFDGRD